jgi:hypothetical protein
MSVYRAARFGLGFLVLGVVLQTDTGVVLQLIHRHVFENLAFWNTHQVSLHVTKVGTTVACGVDLGQKQQVPANPF